LSQPQWIPSSIIKTLQPFTTKSFAALHLLQTKVSERGLELSLTPVLEAVCIGTIALLCIWIFLATLLGVKGFLQDLFSFFPLRK
jgi:hypothetical protein